MLQTAYEIAFDNFFVALDRVEATLSCSRLYAQTLLVSASCGPTQTLTCKCGAVLQVSQMHSLFQGT